MNKFQLTQKGFWLYSPISILALPVTYLAVSPSNSLFILFSIGLLVTFILYFPYLLFTQISKKLVLVKKEILVIRFIILILLVGLIRGILVFNILEVLNINQSSGIVNRTVASMLTTLFWLTCSNLLVNIFEEFKIKYQKALNIFLQNNSNGEINNVIELNKLQETLNKILTNEGKDLTSTNLNNLSISITSHINQVLRPLSRRIWLRSLGEYPKMNFGQLIKDSIRIDDFNKTYLYISITLLALFNNLFIRSFTESLFRTITFLIPLYLLVILKIKLNKISNRFNLMAFILMGFVPVLISEYLSQQFGFSGTWAGTFLIAPVAPVLYIVFSIFNLTLKDQNILIELLTNSNFIDYSKNQNLNNNGKKIASFIHNSLQTELLALASRLEDAAISDNKDKSAQVLQQVSALANRSLIDDFNKFAESPLERLDTIRKSWAGLLNIEININNELLQNKNRNFHLVQIIEEFVTNSYRYGNASEIKVTAESTKSGIVLYLRNDSKKSIRRKKGFGSEWLNKVSINPWKLEKTKLGTLLTIEIA